MVSESLNPICTGRTLKIRKEKRYLALWTLLRRGIFFNSKNTCPRRSYSSTVMKLVIAHILSNYDMELVDKMAPRSKKMWRTTMDPRKVVRVIFRTQSVEQKGLSRFAPALRASLSSISSMFQLLTSTPFASAQIWILVAYIERSLLSYCWRRWSLF
jgi:hypothetical protein